ncbi:hypothetical protein HUJ04_001155 [Dendroctonus ponderosae]|nr:hypothetical protein HUJ04_001155 [Dendroctonus ponderosae]
MQWFPTTTTVLNNVSLRIFKVGELDAAALSQIRLPVLRRAHGGDVGEIARILCCPPPPSKWNPGQGESQVGPGGLESKLNRAHEVQRGVEHISAHQFDIELTQWTFASDSDC